MKSLSLLFAVSLLLGSTVVADAQNGAPVRAYGDQQRSSAPSRDYAALLQEVFAPITDELNLAKEQEFQIIAIITGTEAKADPLLQQLEQVDQRIVEVTLLDSPDEGTINRLSSQEALILTQIIALKTRAKASIYQVLTPEQRTVVSRAFRGKSQLEETLGAIGVN